MKKQALSLFTMLFVFMFAAIGTANVAAQQDPVGSSASAICEGEKCDRVYMSIAVKTAPACCTDRPVQVTTKEWNELTVEQYKAIVEVLEGISPSIRARAGLRWNP